MLWIDAICINQADDAEKEDQVFHMIRIYRRARQIVAWLGIASPDTHIAIAWVHTVNKHLGLDEERNDVYLLETGDKRYVSRRHTAMISVEQFKALENFQSRSWFSRLWIWQEVKSGQDHTILLCGGHMLDWRRVRVAKLYLAGKNVFELKDKTKTNWSKHCAKDESGVHGG